MTTTLSRGAADAVFRKTPTRLYPYVTGRDAAMLGFYLALIVGGILLAAHWLGWTAYVLPLTIGPVAGMVSARQGWRPVHGVVPARARGVLLAQLADAGFVPAAGSAEEERFVYKAPRWLNWDDKSASLRRRPDGDFDATIPSYVYSRVKHRSVPALAV